MIFIDINYLIFSFQRIILLSKHKIVDDAYLKTSKIMLAFLLFSQTIIDMNVIFS